MLWRRSLGGRRPHPEGLDVFVHGDARGLWRSLFERIVPTGLQPVRVQRSVFPASACKEKCPRGVSNGPAPGRAKDLRGYADKRTSERPVRDDTANAYLAVLSPGAAPILKGQTGNGNRRRFTAFILFGCVNKRIILSVAYLFGWFLM